MSQKLNKKIHKLADAPVEHKRVVEGKKSPLAEAKGSKTGTPIQPRKAHTSNAYVESHKTPAAEVNHHLEIQHRKSERPTDKKKQAPKPQDGEQMFPENFNRFGSNFVDTKRVRNTGGY